MTVEVRGSEYDAPSRWRSLMPGVGFSRRESIDMQEIAIEPGAVDRHWRGVALVAVHPGSPLTVFVRVALIPN